MELLITEIYNGLKENNTCDIWIDSETQLILFPTISQADTRQNTYTVQLCRFCDF